MFTVALPMFNVVPSLYMEMKWKRDVDCGVLVDGETDYLSTFGFVL